jgi:hypothetical protein
MSAQTQTGTRRSEAPGPGLEHLRLEVFIGKWINEGNYVATSEAPVAKIVTSDVYESIAGRLSVLHTANGHIGHLDVGGMEIIGYHAWEWGVTSHLYRQLRACDRR